MTIDPDTLRKGDMLLSPDGLLYNVSEAMKIVMNFAFADQAMKDAAVAEGWNPVEDNHARASYVFSLLSLDGQDRRSLTAMGGEPVPDGWEIIAKAPEPEETDEPPPTVTYRR